jgi:hypothetical protein
MPAGIIAGASAGEKRIRPKSLGLDTFFQQSDLIGYSFTSLMRCSTVVGCSSISTSPFW